MDDSPISSPVCIRFPREVFDHLYGGFGFQDRSDLISEILMALNWASICLEKDRIIGSCEQDYDEFTRILFDPLAPCSTETAETHIPYKAPPVLPSYEFSFTVEKKYLDQMQKVFRTNNNQDLLMTGLTLVKWIYAEIYHERQIISATQGGNGIEKYETDATERLEDKIANFLGSLADANLVLQTFIKKPPPKP